MVQHRMLTGGMGHWYGKYQCKRKGKGERHVVHGNNRKGKKKGNGIKWFLRFWFEQEASCQDQFPAKHATRITCCTISLGRSVFTDDSVHSVVHCSFTSLHVPAVTAYLLGS